MSSTENSSNNISAENAVQHISCGYIYKIINLINNKVYIGKTGKTLEARFRAHILDSQKPTENNRPLYKAFNKYGVENFTIELIERCEESLLSEREIYWIDFYRSYVGFPDCNGYNATLGGDGKFYIDKESIFSLYDEGHNIKQIGKITGYDKGYISNILKNSGISQEEILKRGGTGPTREILMLDANTGEKLRYFPSQMAAARFLEKIGKIGSQTLSHCASTIGKCCNPEKINKTCCGFMWTFA